MWAKFVGFRRQQWHISDNYRYLIKSRLLTLQAIISRSMTTQSTDHKPISLSTLLCNRAHVLFFIFDEMESVMRRFENKTCLLCLSTFGLMFIHVMSFKLQACLAISMILSNRWLMTSNKNFVKYLKFCCNLALIDSEDFSPESCND